MKESPVRIGGHKFKRVTSLMCNEMRVCRAITAECVIPYGTVSQTVVRVLRLVRQLLFSGTQA